MHDDWQQLLQHSELELIDGDLKHANPSAAFWKHAFEKGVIAPLLDHGLIKVTGADATAFLQSQLTQDVKSLDDASWRLAGYCNPKGRLLGLFQVLLSDEGFLLLTQRALTEPLLKRLSMFVMRSKVTLEDVSAHTAVIGIAGPAALPGLVELAGTVPETAGHVHRAGDLILLSLGGKPERLLLLIPHNELSAAWNTLSRDVTVAAPAFWTLLDIREGKPEIYPETVEAFVPQQLNMDLIEGISFRKGCYPGQEIVARMHYLGKPSRRMVRLTGPGAQVPGPGSKVSLADGTKAGETVHAAPGPNGLELLAVLHNQHRDRQDLDAGGMKIALADLPYAITDTGE